MKKNISITSGGNLALIFFLVVVSILFALPKGKASAQTCIGLPYPGPSCQDQGTYQPCPAGYHGSMWCGTGQQSCCGNSSGCQCTPYGWMYCQWDCTTQGGGTTACDTSTCVPDAPTPYCGDGDCNGSESCSSCSQDCGVCVVNVTGQCGSSNGQMFTSAPTANLCSAGAPSGVSGSGPWTWTCFGSGTGTSGSCSAKASSPPSVAMDSPATGASVTGKVNISGWAIDNVSNVQSSIASVKVYIDGVFAGNATYGVNRTDVCAAYPGRTGCPNVGYGFSWDSSSVPSGTHTIRVDAIDTDPSPQTGSSYVNTITVGNPPSVSLSATVWASWSGNGRNVPWVYTNSHGPLASYSQAPFALSWTSTNATNCMINGVTVSPAASGTANTYTAPNSAVRTATYTLSCTGAGGTATDSITINVPPSPSNVVMTCPAPGSTGTMTWTPPAGYATFYVRAYDSVYSYPPPSYVLYDDAATGVTATFASQAGHRYTAFVHTRDAASGAWSDAAWAASTPCPSSDYSVTLAPVTQTVYQGGSVAYTATIRSLNNFAGTISLNAANCPAGAVCSLDVSNVALTAGGVATANLTITGTDTVAPGTYNPGVEASFGGASRTGSAQLVIVQIPPVPTVNFSADPNPPLPFNSGTELSWTITNANSCTGSPAMPAGNWTTGGNGSAHTGNLSTTTQYSLTCTGVSGSTTETYTVPVLNGFPGTGSPTTGDASHMACEFNACVWVKGPGVNACSSNADCGGSGSQPVSQPVSAGDATCGSVTLTWQPGAHAVKYNIYRNTANSVPAVPLASNVGGLTYTDPAAFGSTYYYWVESVGGDGTKVPAASNASGGLSPVPCTPGHPTDPNNPGTGTPKADNHSTNASVSCAAITVAWAAPGSGPAPTGYKVYRAGFETGPWTSVAPGGNTLSASTFSYTDASVSGGTVYYYAVVAVNAGAESDPSQSVASGATSPVPCDANLSDSDKDILGVNNVTFTSPPRGACDGFQSIPQGANFKAGDIIHFAINICNDKGLGDATNVKVTDALTNLQRPPTGWNAKLDGVVVTPSSVSGSSPYFESTLTFDVGTVKTAPSTPYVRTLTFDAQLGVPDNYNSTYARFQNSFTIDYMKNTTDWASPPTKFSTPLMMYSTQGDYPGRIEVSP